MMSRQRIVLGMMAYGLTWAAVEMLAAFLRRGYSPYEVVWVRYGVHLAALFCLVGWRNPGALVGTGRLGFHLARSLLMLSMPAAFIIGISDGLAPATVMAVFWVTPLLIVVLARLLIGERAGFAVTAAAAIASVGAMLVLAPPLHTLSRALVWPLAMSFSFCLYVVMTRSLRGESTRVNLFYTAAGVFAALTPAVPFVWITPDLHDLVLLTGIGVIGLLGLFSLDRVLHASSASRMAPLTAFQAIASVSGASLLGHVQPSPELWIGILAICAAAAIVCLPAGLAHPWEAV